MKYVFLAHRDEKQWHAMSTSEQVALDHACLANEWELRLSGHLFAVAGLQSHSPAITVRVLNSKVSLTDGPSAEPKGQPIRLFVIDARDLNEAIRVASKMPQARWGPIEVRPSVE